MKTQSHIRLVVGVVSPFILFVSLVSLPLAREGWTSAAMFPESDTFEFTNNETEDAYDLHIKWNRAVEVKGAEPFKKISGSGSAKSSSDLSNGVVKPTGKASVDVAWDGTAPEVKEWWWTKQNGDRLGKVKTGNPTTASAPATPTSTTGDGLRIVTFDTLQGRVIVNLPDVMRARDTISGTVVAEPKGQSPEERAKNMAVLTGCVIEIEPPKKPDGTSNPKVTAQVTAALSPFTFTLPPSSPPTPPRTNVSSSDSGGLGITLTNTSGSLSIGGTTTVPIEIISLSLQSVAPIQVQFPTLAQPGKPVEIQSGNRSFDGKSATTSCNVAGQPVVILAESPNKVVIENPTGVTGPVEIVLKEGSQETKGTYRNVRVDLTAPKTNLLKGESTELHVEVNGLQGLTQPVPLTLESHGVITMVGGNYQPLVIQPSQVGADGRYTTTRGITGVQTGGWTATATVVTHRFDFCLQDDSNPRTVVLVNSFTGNYLFPLSGGTSLTGTGTVTRKGCIITLTDRQPDRSVQGQIDPCTKTAGASVTVSPKIKFTIIDRNTTNNTCAVQ